MHGSSLCVRGGELLYQQRDCGGRNCERELVVRDSSRSGVKSVPSIESYFSSVIVELPTRRDSPVSSIMTQKDDLTFSYAYDQMALKNPKIFLEKLRLHQISLSGDEEKRLVGIANTQISDYGDSSRVVVCTKMESKMIVVPIALAVPEFLYVCEAQVIEMDAQTQNVGVEEVDQRLTIFETAVGQAFFMEEALLLEKVDELKSCASIKKSDVISIFVSQRKVDKDFACALAKKVLPHCGLSIYHRIKNDLKLGSFSTRAGYNFSSQSHSLVDDQKYRREKCDVAVYHDWSNMVVRRERADVMSLLCFKAHVGKAQLENLSYEDLRPPFMIEISIVQEELAIVRFFDFVRNRQFVTICHIGDDVAVLDVIDLVASSHSPQSKFWSSTHFVHQFSDLPQERDVVLCEVVGHEDSDGDEILNDEYNDYQYDLAQECELNYSYVSPITHRCHIAEMKSRESRFVVHGEKKLIEFELEPDKVYGLWSMLVVEDNDEFDFVTNCDVRAEIRDAQAHYQSMFCQYGFKLEYISDAIEDPLNNHRFWYNCDPKKYCVFDDNENFIWYKYGWMSHQA